MEEDKAAAAASETGSPEIPSSQIEASEPPEVMEEETTAADELGIETKSPSSVSRAGGLMFGMAANAMEARAMGFESSTRAAEESKDFPIILPLPESSEVPVRRRRRASASVPPASGVTRVRVPEPSRVPAPSSWSTRSRYIRVSLLLIGVFAGATSVLIKLWCNPGKPEFFLHLQFVSLLTNIFISICIILLDVMGDFVLSPSFVSLLATIFAHPALWPEIGMLVAQLSTHCSAIFLGYALAQRRTLLERNKITNEEETEPLSVPPMAAPMVGILIHPVVLNVGVAFCLAWVLNHSDDCTPMDLALYCLMSIVACLVFWIAYIVAHLRHAFIGSDGFALVILYLMFVVLIYIFMYVSLGQAVATHATCFASLGLSGLLGYSICLYKTLRASYRHIYNCPERN